MPTRSQKADPAHAERAERQRAWALRAAGGDREAAEQLLRSLLPRVRNLVRYLVRGGSEVDDLAQESMVRMLKGISTYRGEGTVQAWSDRVVARTVFSHFRRMRKREYRSVEYEALYAPQEASDGTRGHLAQTRARCALDALSFEQRQVLLMHHVAGHSVREIAEALRVPFETVRSRLRLGMLRLRAIVTEELAREAIAW